MATLNAAQFKERLKTDHIVNNATVNEPVFIDFRDTGTFTGDFTIQNCALKLFHISNNEFTSLTIKKGSIRELALQTSAKIQRVVLNKCDIQKLTNTETIIEEFEFTAGQVKTVMDGQLASINTMSLSGIIKTISLISPSCSSIQLTNFQANEISLISLLPGTFACKNVMANKIHINYGTNAPGNALFQNLNVKDFEILSEGVRSTKLKGDIKYFSIGTTLQP